MGSKSSILIVEDDPVTRILLEKILAKAGYKTLSVTNGHEALLLFDRSFFPIILTDWIMPEMGGVDLCKAIRARNTEGYVYIILLTARGSKEDTVVGLKAGADDYLTKPFNSAELIARLNTGLRIIALERSLKEANEEIHILSITDPLTGAYNRGYLNKQIVAELKRSLRYTHSLSLILCDIDHFKLINDTYGHQAGDRMLKAFVDCIRRSIRNEIDWVARYGGEEFMIVIPETPVDGAAKIAERIREDVESASYEVSGDRIRFTASFGVTCFEPNTTGDGIDADSMINHVDNLMYQAKHEGRNRVVSARL